MFKRTLELIGPQDSFRLGKKGKVRGDFYAWRGLLYDEKKEKTKRKRLRVFAGARHRQGEGVNEGGRYSSRRSSEIFKGGAQRLVKRVEKGKTGFHTGVQRK